MGAEQVWVECVRESGLLDCWTSLPRRQTDIQINDSHGRSIYSKPAISSLAQPGGDRSEPRSVDESERINFPRWQVTQHLKPNYEKTLLDLCYFSDRLLSLPSPSALRASRRLFSQSLTKQAFLGTLTSHPGVTCLSLNRPQSKNAISRTLLQVNASLMIIEQVLFITLKELRESLESVQFDNRLRRASSFYNYLSWHVTSIRVLILRPTTIGSFCAGARKANHVLSRSREIPGRSVVLTSSQVARGGRFHRS